MPQTYKSAAEVLWDTFFIRQSSYLAGRERYGPDSCIIHPSLKRSGTLSGLETDLHRSRSLNDGRDCAVENHSQTLQDTVEVDIYRGGGSERDAYVRPYRRTESAYSSLDVEITATVLKGHSHPAIRLKTN